MPINNCKDEDEDTRIFAGRDMFVMWAWGEVRRQGSEDERKRGRGRERGREGERGGGREEGRKGEWEGERGQEREGGKENVKTGSTLSICFVYSLILPIITAAAQLA